MLKSNQLLLNIFPHIIAIATAERNGSTFWTSANNYLQYDMEK